MGGTQSCCGGRGLKVLYLHGGNPSIGPHEKVVDSLKAQGLDVIESKLSIPPPNTKPGLAAVPAWLSNALDHVANAIHDAEDMTPFDVLVAGGSAVATACAVLEAGYWAGPLVLLCPDLRLCERADLQKLGDPLRASWIEKTLRTQTPNKRLCRIVHGSSDRIVTIETARQLARTTSIALSEVAGDHSLWAAAGTGEIADAIHKVAAAAQEAQYQPYRDGRAVATARLAGDELHPKNGEDPRERLLAPDDGTRNGAANGANGANGTNGHSIPSPPTSPPWEDIAKEESWGAGAAEQNAAAAFWKTKATGPQKVRRKVKKEVVDHTFAKLDAKAGRQKALQTPQ